MVPEVEAGGVAAVEDGRDEARILAGRGALARRKEQIAARLGAVRVVDRRSGVVVGRDSLVAHPVETGATRRILPRAHVVLEVAVAHRLLALVVFGVQVVEGDEAALVRAAVKRRLERHPVLDFGSNGHVELRHVPLVAVVAAHRVQELAHATRRVEAMLDVERE